MDRPDGGVQSTVQLRGVEKRRERAVRGPDFLLHAVLSPISVYLRSSWLVSRSRLGILVGGRTRSMSGRES